MYVKMYMNFYIIYVYIYVYMNIHELTSKSTEHGQKKPAYNTGI